MFFRNFFPFYARVSYKQRRSKTRTPTRHRRITTPRSGLGTVSVRLVFWKAEIQARTSVPLSGTCQSRRERPVRVLHGGVHTTRTTGSQKQHVRVTVKGGWTPSTFYFNFLKFWSNWLWSKNILLYVFVKRLLCCLL